MKLYKMFTSTDYWVFLFFPTITDFWGRIAPRLTAMVWFWERGSRCSCRRPTTSCTPASCIGAGRGGECFWVVCDNWTFSGQNWCSKSNCILVIKKIFMALQFGPAGIFANVEWSVPEFFLIRRPMKTNTESNHGVNTSIDPKYRWTKTQN